MPSALAAQIPLHFATLQNGFRVNGVWQIGWWDPTGKTHKEGKVLSMTSSGSVVRIFRKYGWFWGGYYSEPKDYMHFQVGRRGVVGWAGRRGGNMEVSRPACLTAMQS